MVAPSTLISVTPTFMRAPPSADTVPMIVTVRSERPSKFAIAASSSSSSISIIDGSNSYSSAS